MNQFSAKDRRLVHKFDFLKLETGFSMLEAVVVVGVLLALAVGGFFAYGPITENAKLAKVRSIASTVHTAVVVASFDGDSNTATQDVLDKWNASTDSILVEILSPQPGETSTNGDFCVQATNRETPRIKAKTGACDPATETPGGPQDGSGPPENPVSTQCVNMSVTDELTCWHSILMQAEANYEATNNHYFGTASYSYQESYTFNPIEMAASPLKWSVSQETYRDVDDPAWDYNAYRTAMIDRDGNFWQGGYYHELNGTGSEADDLEQMVVVNYAENTETVINVKHACDFVTPNTLFAKCSIAGIAPDKYLATSANSDSVAHDDINKIIQAQVSYTRANTQLYGGYGIPVDTQSWAGTTYQSKIFNAQNGNFGYTRIMVVAPNGDLYTADISLVKTNAVAPSPQYTFVFRYTSEMVNRVCTTPFTGSYNQKSDIQTCSSMGYPNFHA